LETRTVIIRLLAACVLVLTVGASIACRPMQPSQSAAPAPSATQQVQPTAPGPTPSAPRVPQAPPTFPPVVTRTPGPFPTPPYPSYVPAVRDLDPQLPYERKSTVLVEHGDGTYERILLDPVRLNDPNWQTQIGLLPGDTVVSVGLPTGTKALPPPPPTRTPVPTATPGSTPTRLSTPGASPYPGPQGVVR